jgi:hypothetical protein
MNPDDEFINIKVTDSRINHIKDLELKEELKKNKTIQSKSYQDNTRQCRRKMLNK